MEAVKLGGLSGKARRVRHRQRAARLYAQQMIEEYAEAGCGEQDHDRYIPIRGRSDFLPPIAQNWSTTAVSTGETQLDLPLPISEKASEGEPSIDAERATRKHAPSPMHETVIRFPRTARSGVSPVIKPPEQLRRRGSRFTLSGFLAGCVMGGAAAALVLLVVQTVVR